MWLIRYFATYFLYREKEEKYRQYDTRDFYARNYPIHKTGTDNLYTT